MLKESHFFYICIELFETRQTMAQLTHFAKLSIMHIEILNI